AQTGALRLLAQQRLVADAEQRRHRTGAQFQEPLPDRLTLPGSVRVPLHDLVREALAAPTDQIAVGRGADADAGSSSEHSGLPRGAEQQTELQPAQLRTQLAQIAPAPS